MQPVRVAVIEEREIFRRGLTACLSDDPRTEVVHASSGGEPFEPVDLVVASASAAEAHSWGVPLVVCAHPGWPGEAVTVDPVFAILPRADLEPAQLIGAVHAAAAGLRIEAVVAPQLVLDLRQVAVLNLLASGAATREISNELGFSERTIKSVIRDTEEHLAARTRAEAVAKAIRLGII